MGIDLRLQGLYLGLLQGLLLQIGALKLMFHLRGHGVKVLIERLKLPAVGPRVDHIAPLAVLQMSAGLHHGLHRPGHIAAEEKDHRHQQRQHQQQDQQRCLLDLGHVPPEDEVLDGGGQAEDVRAALRLEELPALLPRLLPGGEIPLAVQQQPAVQAQPDLAHLLHRLERLEQQRPVTEQHHRGVGSEVAVQQIAGHVELPAVFQQQDVRVHVRHALEHVRFDVLPVLLLAAVAEVAPAGRIGADLPRLPVAEKGGGDALVPGEVLVQIVRHRAVEGGAVPVLLVETIGIAHHAVVGDAFGGLEYRLHADLQLLQRVLRPALQCLPGRLFIAASHQHAGQHHHAQHRQHPAEQDRRQQPGAQRARLFFVLHEHASFSGKGHAAKCTVMARPVRKLVVVIRFLHEKEADSHTSDIGHWFGMTRFCLLQRALDRFVRETGTPARSGCIPRRWPPSRLRPPCAAGARCRRSGR